MEKYLKYMIVDSCATEGGGRALLANWHPTSTTFSCFASDSATTVLTESPTTRKTTRLAAYQDTDSIAANTLLMMFWCSKAHLERPRKRLCYISDECYSSEKRRRGGTSAALRGLKYQPDHLGLSWSQPLRKGSLVRHYTMGCCSYPCDISSEGWCIELKRPTRVKSWSHAVPGRYSTRPCMPTIPNVHSGELWQMDFCSLARSCFIIVLPSLPIVFLPSLVTGCKTYHTTFFLRRRCRCSP